VKQVSLSNSATAIGAVSGFLQSQIHNRINTNQVTGANISPTVQVTVGMTAVKRERSGVLNLNLYEIQFDGAMKNIPCEGDDQPVWLVLKYLMTAFDTEGDSDSAAAHAILSRGIQVLQRINYVGFEGVLETGILLPLQNNPEPLKITFDNVNPDLISKMIQGTNEVFRVSAGFQVRPVLIASGDIPLHPLLVGIDYTKEEVIGYEGVQIDVSLIRQPAIYSIFPARNDAVPGTAITLSGSDLDMPGLVIRLGGLDLPVIAQKADELTFKLNEEACAGGISAGNLPVAVVKILQSDRRSTSNVLNCAIAPVLTAIGPVVTDVTGSRRTFTGRLLGSKKNEIIILLLRENNPVYMFDSSHCTSVPAQTELTVNCTDLITLIDPIHPTLKPGPYQVVFRVNGQEASARPEVVFP